MGKFLLVNSGSKEQHDGNNKDCAQEDNQVKVSGGWIVMDSEFKVSPPMETLE